MKAGSVRALLQIDAVGAGVSAALHGLVLPRLEPWIGMPQEVLWTLGGTALLFLLHDLIGLARGRGQERPWLARILVANGLYCLLTTGLLAWFYPQLTPWDLGFFATEILVILALMRVEWQGLRKARISR